MSFLNLSSLNLRSKSESFWKGEDFFLLAEDQSFKKDLYRIYGRINSPEFSFKLGEFSFLKKDCEYIYDFLRTVKKIRFSLGKYLSPLLSTCLRSKFFDLDYSLKAADDLYFGPEVSRLVDIILEESKSLFEIPFEVSEEHLKKVPKRSSSETLLYLFCLNIIFKRLHRLYIPLDRVVVDLIVDGFYLVTAVSAYSDAFQDSSLSYEDSLGTIVMHNFSLSDKSMNHGVLNMEGGVTQWFAWTQ